MTSIFNRRRFIQMASTAGFSIGLAPGLSSLYGASLAVKGRRIGLIGLDTSHSIEIINALNGRTTEVEDFQGYTVVAAYPRGSADIASSANRIPAYTIKAQTMGVKIVGSIDELLKDVDYVCLETNDGRARLDQALQVLKAGKPMFMDKPVAASLSDIVKIYDAAEKYGVPVFSTSSLRYISGTKEILEGNVIGKVLGADTYSPANLEPSHPDLFWYGIHGVESLFALMGRGCERVVRTYSGSTDVVVGSWRDGRIGVFRGTRDGQHAYGGTVFGEKGVKTLGQPQGTIHMLLKIIEFFNTGIAPVSREETIEIYTFMAAAQESKDRGGISVRLEKILQNAK
ncbi:Gfo/Idh/MocA family protein [Pedobacter nyackensis]|uniref:Gfo/Idh/MocA family protein n=1 Tax=Pedobacter nyackensis TaxID=475255 RepID=UPI00292E6934|nr:Gfo/Idh/MocA family oxidoreductase [Pedobacter nyackensis]